MKRPATSVFQPQPRSVDDALLAPWIATGVVDSLDSRLFAAALVSDPALADDLAAARAEQIEVVAMAESLGRPSMRPLLALFATLDAESGRGAAANVTRLTFDRARLTCLQRIGRDGIPSQKNQRSPLNARRS